MGIEIRPAAVLGQLSEKSNKTSALREECKRIKKNIDLFYEDAFDLCGTGFDSAKNHFREYISLIDAIIAMTYKIDRSDDVVKNALLNRFGSEVEVSEDYWRNRQQEAMDSIKAIDDKLEESCKVKFGSIDTVAAAYIFDSCVSAKAQWQTLENRASAMLSKIYSYCDETNNIYGGIDELATAISKGILAFSNSFDYAAKTWNQLDTSWKNDIDSYFGNAGADILLAKSLGGEPIFTEDGWAYIDGKRYDLLDAEDFELADSVMGNLGEESRQSVLEGLWKDGFESGSLVASEHGFAELSGVLGKAAKFGGVVLVGIFGVVDAKLAYDSAYTNSRGTEDQRRSKAESAAAKKVGTTVVSTGGGVVGAYAGAAIGSLICPGIGTAIGGLIGGIIGSVAAETASEGILASDFDGDGITLSTEIDGGWYESVHKPVNDEARFAVAPVAY